MAFWAISALRAILDTETDADSDLNEELMSQLRENIEAVLMLTFYTGDSGTATSNPPNDTTGVLTDSAGGYSTDEYNGCSLLITSGTAKGNIYTIDDTTGTTLVCTGDNLYDDGVRSGDSYHVFFDLKNASAHDHDGVNSPEVVLADSQVTTIKINNLAVTQAKIAANAVGTSEIKEGSDSGTRSVDGYSTMTGGRYSFWPQTYGDSLTSTAIVTTCYGNGSGTYATHIGLSGRAAGTMYWRNYYVAASGERHWVYIQRDKRTGEIMATLESKDHPSYGNGGRPEILRHPFGPMTKENGVYKHINPDGSKTDCEIIVINPDFYQVQEIIRNQCDKNGVETKPWISSMFELYDIDEIKTPPWNNEPVTVELPRVDIDGQIIGDYRFNGHGKKVVPIKRSVPKPQVMNLAQLKRKKP
jgi:hypothetical protein